MRCREPWISGSNIASSAAPSSVKKFLALVTSGNFRYSHTAPVRSLICWMVCSSHNWSAHAAAAKNLFVVTRRHFGAALSARSIGLLLLWPVPDQVSNCER